MIRYGPQLVERACIISDYEEVLDHLFQNGTPLDKDYIFEIIKKCNRWYDGLHYLMKKGYKLSRYVSRGRTVFTEMERRALLSNSVHYDYVSEIYLYLIRYGYDVNERESVEPYKAGYEVIPVKCEEYLWDVVLKSTPVEMLAEHFILGNDRDRMEYLFENGLSKKFRIGPQRVLMYDFAMKNHVYKSAHVLYNHDKSFDPRYFFDKKLFLESLVKRGELDFVAALCEDGIGFAEQDFKDPRCDRCSKSFHCACVADANIYRILNAGETHIPTLIYSILANENDDTAIKGLEIFKKLKKLDIDLQPYDEEYRFVLKFMQCKANPMLIIDILQFLTSNGANIRYEDVSYLMLNKCVNAINVVKYLKKIEFDLSGSDAKFHYIQKAVSANQLSEFIELLYDLGAKYSNGDFDITYVIKNHSYETLSKFLDTIMNHDINLEKYDEEKKYYHTLLTTEKNEPITLKLLKKMKKAGANPKNSISISMLLKGEENVNQENIKEILAFFVENKADVSEDDKENFLLDIIFQYDNVYIRNIDVVRMVAKLGADPSRYTENLVLFRLIKKHIIAHEYFEEIIKAGAKVNEINQNEETALIRVMKVWGKSKKRRDVIKVLIKYGADPTMEDVKGFTALKLAKENNDNLSLMIMKK